MKLLFDENLSPRLVERLAPEFPDSLHLRAVGLRGADDQIVWDFARREGFLIVSKDTDFRERSLVEGFPPKVIWLAVGNAATGTIAELLRKEFHRIASFEKDGEASVLILSIGEVTI